jgi:hypothetical protein
MQVLPRVHPRTCDEARSSILDLIKAAELISYRSRQRRIDGQHDAQQMSVGFAARLHPHPHDEVLKFGPRQVQW